MLLSTSCWRVMRMSASGIHFITSIAFALALASPIFSVEAKEKNSPAITSSQVKRLRKPASDELKFHVYEKYVRGLSNKEASHLKGIFDSYAVIDLEASGLTAWRSWLDEVTERLTESVMKHGDQYPTYRIEILASDEPTAFVAKFRNAGFESYRGYVYFSTGLLDKMAATLQGAGKKVSDLNPELFQKVLDGMTGVIAHEFAHPKQDETVKWSWRSAQDKSTFNHGQVDEATTDFLGMRLLKDAELPPDNMLTGLQLLFGDKPENSNRVIRILQGGLSTHPQDNLRLNLNRGALTQLRMKEGLVEAKAISVPVGDLLLESKIAETGTSLRTQVRGMFISGLPENASEFSRVLELLKRNLRESGSAYSNRRYTKLLNQIVQEGYAPNSDEQKAYLAFYDSILANSENKREGVLRCKSLALSAFNTYDDLVAPGTYFPDSYKKRQVRVSPWARRPNQARAFRLPLGETPKILSDLQTQAFEKAWSEMSVPEKVHAIDHLDPLFERNLIEKAFEQLATEVGAHDELIQVEFHLARWARGITFNQTEKIDHFAYAELKKIMSQVPFSEQKFIPRMMKYFLYERVPLLYLKERARKDAAFLAVYNDVFGVPVEDLLRHADNPPALGIDLAQMLTSSERPSLLSWQVSPYKENLPILQKADRPYLGAYWNRIQEIFNSDQNQKAIVFYAEYYQKADEFVKSNSSARFFGNWANYANAQPEKVAEPIHEVLIGGLPDLKKKLTYIYNSVPNGPLNWQFYADMFPLIKAGEEELYWNSIKQGTNNELKILDILRKRKQITPEVYATRSAKLLEPVEGKMRTAVTALDHFSTHIIWKDLQEGAEKAPGTFLKYVLDSFDLGKFDRALDQRESTNNALKVKLKYHPDYVEPLAKVHKGLKSDFLKYIGYTKQFKNFSVTDPEFRRIFVENFAKAQEYLALVFNPDGMWLSAEIRQQFNGGPFDRLLFEFVPVVPVEDLSPEQKLTLWNIFTAKRANRYTDEFFEENLLKGWLNAIEPEKTRMAEAVLGRDQLRSERMKMLMTRHLVEPKLDELSKVKGKVPDNVVFDLVGTIQRYNQPSSRFKDDFIEEIAWKLELSEKQCMRFIEPMKSFNYKGIDPRTLNALSALSVSLEYLSVKEKLQFLRHIQNPVDDLIRTIPNLKRVIETVGKASNKTAEVEAIFDYLETFIRDASDGEKLVLSEVLIGTRGHGLWFKGPEVRNELYELAGFKGNDEKRLLFESYIKALPAHEHSLTLSYLISTYSPKPQNELLKTLELFGTPGIKFAQMASIMQVFGPERSAELSKAKNRAAPPTRSEIYGLLRGRMSPEEFSKITRVKKLLGSGSIKFVVSVEFSDGRSEAVYIRRPFLDDTIRDTLDLSERWMTELRKDEGYANKFDYDYYIRTLRQQLADEIQFKREFDLTKKMNELYGKVRSYKGWRFQPVSASSKSVQGDSVLFYSEVKGAVTFDMLTEAQKLEVGPYILKTELEFLFAGQFDADRHIGNYLIDASSKRIYPLDLAQSYSLNRNRFFTEGDPYYLAKIFLGLGHDDKTKGAKILSETFVKLHDAPNVISRETQALLASEIEAILKYVNADGTRLPMNEVFVKILDRLNFHRVRLPSRMSLGVVKDLLIILNEEYAKTVPAKVRDGIIKSFVRKQIVLGARYTVFDKIEDLFSTKVNCRDITHDVL